MFISGFRDSLCYKDNFRTIFSFFLTDEQKISFRHFRSRQGVNEKTILQQKEIKNEK